MKDMKKRPKVMGLNRSDRFLREYEHDTYHLKSKQESVLLCPECHALYSEGRWQWVQDLTQLKKFMKKLHKKDKDLCPACKRTMEHYPAGELVLRGEFLFQHLREILGLAKNEELAEMGEHPLNRIMEIKKNKHEVLIETTDQHLPRRIATALKRAYGGTLDFRFAEASGLMRVFWDR